MYRRYFNGTIPKPVARFRAVQFTLKFRTSSSHAWKWVNEHSTLTDGELFFQTPELPQKLESCFDVPDSAISIKSVETEIPCTRLWVLNKSLGVADAKPHISHDRIGIPLHLSRWFALVRIWTPWLAPRHGQGSFHINEDAMLCSFLRHDGLHLVLLAVSGVEDVLTLFKDDGKGGIIAWSQNDSDVAGQARIIVAIGRSFDVANAACMSYARKIVNSKENTSAEVRTEIAKPVDDEQRTKRMESWYDGLTYCTWNSLGQDLNEQKIYDALDDLKTSKINITNLIIDDGWQSLDNPGASQFRRGMTNFDAHKGGFPRGLQHTVTSIRSKHPNIQHIGVWHALLGYWGGIASAGEIARKYKVRQVTYRSATPSLIPTGTMIVVDSNDVQRMYNDFYQFLRNCGVDSVKTDAQFFIDYLDHPEDRVRLIRSYQDAWTTSSLRYFSTKAISCMSQVPQILFRSQLLTNKPRLMVRNSDDFFPEIPASHTWHIFTNAFNSLVTSHLNVLPDWDMFQTSHDYSSFHAAGRCISGGPVYITDEPGKHDMNLVDQITALSPQDITIVLRPSNVAKTIDSGVYTAYEEERLLKVGTFHGHRSSGTSFLGVFNVSTTALSELVALKDFPGLEDGSEYIVRAHSTGEISNVMKKTDTLPFVSLELVPKGWEILSAYPIVRANHPHDPAVKIAVLGLLGKMTGAAAVLDSNIQLDKNGTISVSITSKALGVLGMSIPVMTPGMLTWLGVYISDLGRRCLGGNIKITIFGKPVSSGNVKQSQLSELVLEIDFERAWNEMELRIGHSNEVAISVFLG